jgi:hypothetical protein
MKKLAFGKTLGIPGIGDNDLVKSGCIPSGRIEIIILLFLMRRNLMKSLRTA